MLSDSGQSADNRDWPHFEHLISLIRKGKVGGIVTWQFNRLTSDLQDLLALADLLEETGTALVSVSDQIATDTPGWRTMLSILGSVAQWERQWNRDTRIITHPTAQEATAS